jgi:hypothetical protein
MKMLSTICTVMFVIGMIASSAHAQSCTSNEECTPPLLCSEELSLCVECIIDDDCSGNEMCNDAKECVYDGPTLQLDIKPGSCPNPLNVRSRGVLPVVIFGTEKSDVSSIDPDSLVLVREGIDGEAPVIRYNYDDVGTPSPGELCDCEDIDEDNLNDEDIDGDGFVDLTVKFRVQDLVGELNLDEVESKETILLAIMGESADGSLILGEDCVRIINKMKWWQDILEKIKKPKKPQNKDEE